MYTTVVVATDGSVTAERAMARAVELTRLASARLHVVTVSRGGRGPVAPNPAGRGLDVPRLPGRRGPRERSGPARRGRRRGAAAPTC
ncbi:MAG: universal stress protein [Thermoleophilaceae bacterium]|nr:universal stress protein [Thermoleophilaceae bacterium]